MLDLRPINIYCDACLAREWLPELAESQVEGPEREKWIAPAADGVCEELAGWCHHFRDCKPRVQACC